MKTNNLKQAQKRIHNLNREDLLREYMDELTAGDIWNICFEYIHADIENNSSKFLRSRLLEDLDS